VSPSAFVAALARVRLPDVFNPYSDHCSVYDRISAAEIRRKNLETFLEVAIQRDADTIWVARDLGHRGGRRTGIPMVDDVRLAPLGLFMGGASFMRATRGAEMSEATAGTVWQVMSGLRTPVILWNVFPLHPHNAGNPFSNRQHTAYERKETSKFLTELIAMVRPKRLVAIGRDAETAVDGWGVPVTRVRHPSYGGKAEFVAGLSKLYGI
jgi:hypothetical protein